MTVLIDQDIVGLYVSMGNTIQVLEENHVKVYNVGIPMYETELVYCFNGKHAFCNVESSDILRERVVFNEHGHKIAAGQKFHDQVEVGAILE